MCGGPVTSGLAAKRSSSRASGTSSSSSCRIACAQKETSRAVSGASIPTLALNHWRSESTRLIIAIGVPQIWAASRARSSKSLSAGLSRIS
jgi:hypothetical protein